MWWTAHFAHHTFGAQAGCERVCVSGGTSGLSLIHICLQSIARQLQPMQLLVQLLVSLTHCGALIQM